MIEIKFKPTGHTFTLPDEEAIRIVKEDRGNYQVVKGKVPEEKNKKKLNRYRNWSLKKKKRKIHKAIITTLKDKTKTNLRKQVKMTLTFLTIYNEVAGQAWSMYDGDAESVDEMESALKSSINKALSEIWCSYPFPFRIKTMTITTREGVNEYATPNGNILKKQYQGNKFIQYE